MASKDLLFSAMKAELTQNEPCSKLQILMLDMEMLKLPHSIIQKRKMWMRTASLKVERKARDLPNSRNLLRNKSLGNLR